MQSCCEFPLAALLVVMVLAVQSSCSSLQASALRQCKDVQLWTCILCMEGSAYGYLSSHEGVPVQTTQAGMLGRRMSSRQRMAGMATTA